MAQGRRQATATEPPWVRLLFLLVQGRDGQWWRAILLVAPRVLLLLTLVGLIFMIAAWLPFGGWASGILGVASLTTEQVYRRSRKK